MTIAQNPKHGAYPLIKMRFPPRWLILEQQRTAADSAPRLSAALFGHDRKIQIVTRADVQGSSWFISVVWYKHFALTINNACPLSPWVARDGHKLKKGSFAKLKLIECQRDSIVRALKAGRGNQTLTSKDGRYIIQPTALWICVETLKWNDITYKRVMSVYTHCSRWILCGFINPICNSCLLQIF